MQALSHFNLRRAITWVICALLVLPIVLVVVMSFGKSPYILFPPTSFSTRWYEAFFSSYQWMNSLWTSLSIAVMTSIIATTLGFLGAYALVRGQFGHKKLIISLCLLPLIVPSIITSIALYFASVPLDLIGSKVWIAICHSSLAIPIVLLIMLSALQGVDISVERAAAGLGASKLYTFRRVIIPMVAPGIVSAAFFSFLTSFDELIISLFLSGVQTETLPVRIWNSLIMSMEPIVAAISSFLILVTIVLLLFESLVRRARA